MSDVTDDTRVVTFTAWRRVVAPLYVILAPPEWSLGMETKSVKASEIRWGWR